MSREKADLLSPHAGEDADDGPEADVSADDGRDDTSPTSEPDTVDQATADPGIPSDNLRIVSQEPRRMGRRFAFDCHRSVTFLQYAISILFFAVLLLAVVVGYLRTLELEPVVPAPITSAGSCAGPISHVCDKPGCVLRAAETVLFFNRSADPCSDFYSYACGGFGAAHPSDTMRPLGLRQVLERRNRGRLLALLREEQFFNTSTPSAISKAKVFFSTCMSSYERGVNQVMTLVELLKRLGGLELFGTWTINRREKRAVVMYPEETQFDFNNLLSNTSTLHQEQAFFEVRYDRQLNLLALDLPRLAMGFVEAATQPGSVAHEQLTSRLRSEMRVVLAHLERDSHGVTKQRSCGDNCIDIMVDDILAVQDALAVLRPEPGAAGTAVQRRVSLAELGQLVPQIDWRRLLDVRYGKGVVPDTVTVRIPSSEYMAGVSRVIDDTRFQRLYHFLVWPLIRSYLVALGPVYATFSEQLDHEFGLKPLKSREQQCVALLEKHMKPAMHGLILSEHIGEKNLPLVRDLLEEARGPLIDSFAWMSEHSRRVSEDFLGSVNVDFGDAPSVLGPLNDYYSPLRFNTYGTSFFHNLKQLYALTPPVHILDNPLFGDRPLGSAAVQFDVGRRTLTVPHGALQTPWFDADVPQALNAAALGSYVYEALAVPFFLVHMSVNETFQWDKETLWRLDDFTNCLSDVVKRKPIQQDYLVPLSSSTTEWTEHHFMTFSSTFSPEVATVLLAREYFSYHLSHRLHSKLSERGPDLVLPGLRLNSSEQAFYLAFAQARCHNGYRDEELFHAFGELPRLPQHLAVNSLVYSDDQFRDAFRCGARRPAEGASRDISSCELFKWPVDDGNSTTETPTTAEKKT